MKKGRLCAALPCIGIGLKRRVFTGLEQDIEQMLFLNIFFVWGTFACWQNISSAVGVNVLVRVLSGYNGHCHQLSLHCIGHGHIIHGDGVGSD